MTSTFLRQKALAYHCHRITGSPSSRFCWPGTVQCWSSARSSFLPPTTRSVRRKLVVQPPITCLLVVQPPAFVYLVKMLFCSLKNDLLYLLTKFSFSKCSLKESIFSCCPYVTFFFRNRAIDNFHYIPCTSPDKKLHTYTNSHSYNPHTWIYSPWWFLEIWVYNIFV